MASAVEHTVELRPGAIVTSVVATVTASARPRTVPLGEVAQVTSDSAEPMTAPAQCIIVEFGSPRVISSLSSDLRWDRLNSPDVSPSIVVPETPGGYLSKSLDPPATVSVLQISFQEAVAPARAATSTTVVVDIPPADLEILANNSRAWGLPGLAEPTSPSGAAIAGATPSQFTATVDVTRALQDEVAAGRVPVRVLLRSRTPGNLTLSLKSTFHQVHQVAFPEGPGHSVEASAEGDIAVDLPLPPEAARWTVVGVDTILSAQAGADRVLPATGPDLSPDASLVVDPDRALTVGLPVAATGSLATLAGVRIPVRVGPGGAELRGALRGDADGEPGDPVPRGQLGPATVEGGADVHWVGLLLPKPQKLRGSSPLWVDIAATRGSVEVPLARPTGAATGTAVRRSNAGGGYRRLAPFAGIADAAAAVRVVGVPQAQKPLPPADLAIAGAPGAVATVTPTAVGAAVSLQLAATGVTPTSVAGQPGPRVFLRLVMTARTAGTFTLGPVSVAYGSETVEQ